MATRQNLPHDATWIAAEDGWLITLPARLERVEVGRRVVETDEVLVRLERRQEVQRVAGETRREELRVETRGEVDVTQPIATYPVLHK